MNASLRHLLLLLSWLALSAPAAAGAPSDARGWLERMATAMNQLSYQGTFVYLRDGRVETMRITHVVDDDGTRERLVSVDGPHRELIRDENGVRCVIGDDDAEMMQDPLITRAYFPDLPLADIAASNGAYVFETGGTARIAGHTARRVSIQPGDAYRYGYDFWLEVHSGLLLKWVLYDTRKNALAKLMFTDLRLGSEVDPRELRSDTPPERFTPLRAALPPGKLRSGAGPRWEPARLPPGFRLETHTQRLGDGGEVFGHLVYSDGLAAVSVYIESVGAADEAIEEGVSRLGTAHAYSRNMGAMRVTVIGEVPAETVRSIGSTVTLLAGGD